MSSIDSPEVIRKLIEKDGADPGGMCFGRRAAFQIWQYTTGFGGICYKLIYGLYPNGMNDEEAAARFLGTANIKPGTTPVCLWHTGKLTKAGEEWWSKHFGILTMPGNKN